ncbi:hypothetical protein WJ968_07205 [Achromobacter xylosoxidans]
MLRLPMFLAQGGQPVDVRVQLRLGAQSVIARRPRARQRLIGILEHALGLAVARVQQRAALGGHALEQPVAIAGRQFAGQARQRFSQMALGVASRRAERLALALLDPQQPGDARLLGLALSTSGQVEAQQRRQRILTASPSRRSTPPSISSSQRALVRNCFFST